MVETQAELESTTVDLTVEAFNTFAEDISTMFDTEVSATQVDVGTGSITDLKSTYKKLAAVCSVKASGMLNGEFHVVFDKEGLFTLAGTFVMQPTQIITQNRKNGEEDDANEIGDALGEVGNLMVGSWDRAFREEIEDHGHFVQNGTFVGNPWMKPEDKIRLTSDEELTIVAFEMTVAPLPSFKCSVLYPKSIFEPPVEEAAEVAEGTEVESDPGQDVADEKGGSEVEAVADGASADKTAVEEPAVEGDPGAESSEAEAQAQDSVDGDSEQTNVQVETESTKSGPVSESIAKITHSLAGLPGHQGSAAILTELSAAEVMRTDVVWAGLEDTVEQLVARMQQHDTGYVLVGENDNLEGIVSKSDVRGALSPYLQSMFVKWRSPMDIATLQIKAQWVMSRPVRTVRPDATLMSVMQAMSDHGGRCMPVVDQQGKVQGIVTVFDIINVLLVYGKETLNAGRTSESPPLA